MRSCEASLRSDPGFEANGESVPVTARNATQHDAGSRSVREGVCDRDKRTGGKRSIRPGPDTFDRLIQDSQGAALAETFTGTAVGGHHTISRPTIVESSLEP